MAVRTDVSKPEQIHALADAAIEAFDKVHVLCQNAGVEGYLDGPLWAATDNDLAWTCPGTIATNLFLGSRNRPSELTDDAAAVGADQGRELRERMHATLAQGMPPAEVAE